MPFASTSATPLCSRPFSSDRSSILRNASSERQSTVTPRGFRRCTWRKTRIEEGSVKLHRGILIAVVATAIVVAAAVFVLAPAASARGNVGAPVRQGATNHTISVGGHGEIQVAPDQATLTV